MDDILNGPADDAGTMGEAVPDAAGKAPAETDVAGGAPPAPGITQVPLAALEAERRGRRDWKDKAIRAEAERDTMRAQLDAARSVPAPALPDPVFNERLNMSEALLRQQHDDVDAQILAFRRAAEADPALRRELRQQPHPYQWAYEQGKRLQLLAEIGSDPEAYRRRVEEEVRAGLLSGDAAPASARAGVPIPASLATARSSAPRHAAPWTGPTPLSDILPG